MNWPTLSKDPDNPDADLWDPKNPSHCAFYLRKEGLDASGVRRWLLMHVSADNTS